MADGDERAMHLTDTFPPVPTSAWEAQIRQDLKGADYERRLVWTTDEGIAVRPYYRSEDAPRRQPVGRAARTWEMVPPDREPAVEVSTIDAHEHGATATQEVAWALAQGAERLAAGQPVTTIGFAVGSNHFMEIAKLRAARLLWAGVASAFGAPTAVRLHARTAGENKTRYDASVNLLRVTTEALSAILGGCDSLTIAPCGFDPHLADNVHHILREESHLDQVADPGAGAYSLEALTDAVAAEAWAAFQEIERAGGWAAFAASGALDAALASARAAKQEAVDTRRRTLVGTNNYPNLLERGPAPDWTPGEGWRLAAGFEAVRRRTERHAASIGRTPRVLLLERGDPKMRAARAAFCLNLFGCAGFDLVSSDELAEADLVVLCSADAEYLDFARDIVPRTKAPVAVAGRPNDLAAALEGAGVAGFVWAGADAVAALTEWQDRVGMER